MLFLEKYLDANLKLFSYILFMVFFYQSCAPNTLLQNNYGLKALRKPINEIIIDSGLDVSIGIKMVSLKNGETLYELNSEYGEQTITYAYEGKNLSLSQSVMSATQAMREMRQMMIIF